MIDGYLTGTQQTLRRSGKRRPAWYWQRVQHRISADWWGAPDLSWCAYYRQGAPSTCSFGCSDEPSCQTGHPSGGWPAERRLWLRWRRP